MGGYRISAVLSYLLDILRVDPVGQPRNSGFAQGCGDHFQLRENLRAVQETLFVTMMERYDEKRSVVQKIVERLEQCGASAVLIVLMTFFAAEAFAQNCDTFPGNLIETYPAHQSRNIPINGTARVVYCPEDFPIVDRNEIRLYQDMGGAEPGCVCENSGECQDVNNHSRCLIEVPIELTIEGDEVLISLVEGTYSPNSVFYIQIPQPTDFVWISFSTADQLDESFPDFSGLDTVEVIGCGAGFASNAACPQNLEEEGFVSILRADAARDEAGAVNIEYTAFQVRNDEWIERGRVRGDGVNDVTLSVFISSSQLTSREWEQICFALSATDPYGYETRPERTVCELTPEFSPFNSACATVSQRTGSLGDLLPATLLLLILLVIRGYSKRFFRATP